LADRSGFLFCKRYFGIELSPWQQVSWETMEDLWDSPDREFLCENAAPGLGKSTVKVAFAAKRIVLNRAVRVLFISRAQSLAERNTMRLRRALERTSPAVGAMATLSGDFGRFKPSGAGDVWRKHEFVVEQSDGTPIEEKEPTVSSFGFDAEWLGNRLDLMFGDDLDSTRSIRNFETVQVNRQIFDDELEPRLEGGGLMAITQQRLGPFDFSSHALSKQVLFDDDGVSEEVDSEPQYRHLVFKAHYDDRCRGIETHRPGAPPWPEGCLLDPRRLTWRDIRKAMNSRRRFAVVYQQEEADESDALVPRLWVDGGRGSDGVDYPGCWDKNRGLADIPEGLVAPNLSVVTCDPSPTRFWSIQWWLVNAPTEQRFLLDLVRQAMDAPDFLDFNMNEGRLFGVVGGVVAAERRHGVAVLASDRGGERGSAVHAAVRPVPQVGDSAEGVGDPSPDASQQVGSRVRGAVVGVVVQVRPGPPARPPRRRSGADRGDEAGRRGDPVAAGRDRRLCDGRVVLGVEPSSVAAVPAGPICAVSAGPSWIPRLPLQVLRRRPLLCDPIRWLVQTARRWRGAIAS
jgi:hypothetical protein